MALGIDPIHLGVIMVVNMEIGMLEGLGFKAIDTKEDAFGKQRMMRAGKS
jgi:hypothetical protein